MSMFAWLTPLLRFSVTLAALIGTVSQLRGELLISEFLAVNSGIELTDEDGFPADWIEIQNPGSESISLSGYALTDDPLIPTKWIFPNLTLPAFSYLRVFATGKDRKNDPDFLHTNFSLNSSGEYLALVKPDGFSIADEFSPQYPPQFKDISYGFGNGSSVAETTILPLGAPLTYFVPTAEIGDAWKSIGFDDSTWTTSASAIGYRYEDKPSLAATISANGDVRNAMFQKNASIYLRFSFDIVDPAGVFALRLNAKIDDGFVAYLNGVEIASENPPVAPLAFNSASGGSVEVLEGQEFSIYELAIENNLVAGENILAFQAMNSNAGNSDFLFISELEGNIQDLTAPFVRGFFPTPTPGTPNVPLLLAPASEVQFDHSSQAFTEDFQLILSVAEPEAIIRYTTNGDDVNETSEEYTEAIPITGSTQIRARAFLPSALPSPSQTVGFIKLATSEADFSSNLPVVILSTFNEGVPPATGSTERKDVFMLIYEPDPVTGRTTLAGTPSVSTRGGFRKRGSSSANFPKYGMSFESWDELNDDKDINPFGFGNEADWILNARYTFDLSLMRNAFLYNLSNQIGRWAVETKFVELYNDTSGTEVTASDYFGVYTFMERIDSDNSRLDIAGLDPWENSPEEVTGGYIFKRDRADPGEPPFSVSGLGSPVVHVEPDTFQLTDIQRSYITGHLNEINPALTNPSGVNPSTGLHYSDYLDVDSFIDNFWLNTLAMDPDWGRLSQFFYKDRGEKLSAGPIWDYDRTMGSRDSRDDDPQRWAGPGDSSVTWYDRRFPFFGNLYGFTSIHEVTNLADPQLKTSRPDLFQKLIDRWYELRDQGFSTPNMNGTIQGLASELSEAQQRNFSRWTQLTPGSITGINYAQQGLGGWNSEISHLEGWLEARALWIDDQFLGRPTLAQNGGVVEPGFELVMSSPEGQTFFTTDGSDPRALGGAPSPTANAFDGGVVEDVLLAEIEAAANYLVPSNDSLSLTWTQANFDDTSWATGASGIGFETGGGTLEPSIKTNIRGEMFSVNASCYLRFKFDFDNRENINALILGMKYDDGFIAYLNGVEIARDRAPEASSWNSNATGARSDSVAIGSFVQFDITENADAVLNGQNVLAIHGMNFNAANTDFLCLPTLSVNHTVSATPVILNETTTVTARSYDGQQWGAPTKATFIIGAIVANSGNLVISEIMYDPAPPTAIEEAAGFTSDSFFEYLEIYNTSANTVDLNAVTFTSGFDFNFAGSNVTFLPPGGRALIARSIAGFTQRYGSGFTDLIAGEFANGTGLSGNGERIVMTGLEGVIADLRYDNNPPWPTTPDGQGPSLVYLSGAAEPYLASNWRPSVAALGNPGTSDATTFSGTPNADLDNDGLSAFAEYALGTSDQTPNTDALIGSLAPDGTYAFTFSRSLAADDAEIIMEISDDLESWSPAIETFGLPSESYQTHGIVTYTFRTLQFANQSPRLFGRLLILER